MNTGERYIGQEYDFHSYHWHSIVELTDRPLGEREKVFFLLPSLSIFLISLQPMDTWCDNRHTESWLIPCQDQ